MNKVSHLGGHCNRTWIDEGVLKWVKEKYNTCSMVDIGCGPGGMREVAKSFHISWDGVDGDPKLFEKKLLNNGMVKWDFTEGPLPNCSRFHFDLGWSVEFLEHVAEEYQDNYMSLFQRCDYVVCTAAPPGWGGHHHVNEQKQEYWIEVFKKYGFVFKPDETEEMRCHSTMKKNSKRRSFMKSTGMFFINSMEPYAGSDWN